MHMKAKVFGKRKKMNRYLVLLSTKTTLRLIPEDGSYNFKIGDENILFRRIQNSRDEEISGSGDGWIIVVELNVKNLDEAVSKATNLSEFFLSAFCFETAREVFPSNKILAYDITKGTSERTFRQYFRNLPFSDTEVNFQSFNLHAEKIYALNHKHKARIYRAIRWFRKGIISDDSLDQFLYFWFGLETLNSPLAEHFKCKKAFKKEVERQCKICGEKYLDATPDLGGVNALLDDLKVYKNIRDKIRVMRTGIVHGFEELTRLNKLAIELVPAVAKFLHIGLEKILDMHFDTSFYNRLNSVSPIKPGDFFYMEFTLLKKNPLKLGVDGYYPYFTIDELQFKPEKAGITYNLRAKPHLNCKYKSRALGIIGGKNINLRVNEVK